MVVQFVKGHEFYLGSKKVSTDTLSALNLTDTFEETYFLSNTVFEGTLDKNLIPIPLYLKDLRLCRIVGFEGQSKSDKWDDFLKELDKQSSHLIYDQAYGNEALQSSLEMSLPSFRITALRFFARNSVHLPKLKYIGQNSRHRSNEQNLSMAHFQLSKSDKLTSINCDDLKADTNSVKVEAIREIPTSSDMQALRRFLGIVNKMQKFDQRRSAATAIETVDQEHRDSWNQIYDKAFSKLGDIRQFQMKYSTTFLSDSK
ncbi:hypothetical protein CHS0354_017614 [Potamilus streckersoni]|uniref:Uncharacterized protein n=1 Tax=Potamilus streckersoni TaxID=2493646 RepID=A0AAE0RNZ8_9BIVA|nr:hypothetical protein CHS0354_017614 [Potamilus streckersoni]